MATLVPRLAKMDASPVYRVIGDAYTQLASGADTGGAFCLFHAVIPAGNGPPPHTHTREDEAFYILEGEFTFDIGQADGTYKQVVAHAGDYVFAPRGIPHRFHNSGSTVAKMLFQAWPAGIEHFFAKLDQSADSDASSAPPTPEFLAFLIKCAAEFGLVIHAPV